MVFIGESRFDMNKMISKTGSAIVTVTVFLFAIFLLIFGLFFMKIELININKMTITAYPKEQK